MFSILQNSWVTKALANELIHSLSDFEFLKLCQTKGIYGVDTYVTACNSYELRKTREGEARCGGRGSSHDMSARHVCYMSQQLCSICTELHAIRLLLARVVIGGQLMLIPSLRYINFTMVL